MVWLYLILVSLALLIYWKVFKPLQFWDKLGVPHLKPFPLIGNSGPFLFKRKCLSDWISDMYHSYDNKTRYFGITNFLKPALIIKDVNLIKQIAIKEFDHFVDHSQFVTEEIDPLFGKNLFSLRGNRWRHMRSTLSPAFTGRKMRTMFLLISDCANYFTDHYTKIVDTNKPLTIEMKDLFSRFSSDVIASTAFGIKCDSLLEKNNEFYTKAKDAIDFTGIKALKFFGCTISMTLMKFLRVEMFGKQMGQFFRNLIVSTIKTREIEGIIRPDMIHLLMEARKGKLKHDEILTSVEDSAGFATVEESYVGKDARMAKLDLSDDDITAQALIFLAGGFDTISTLLCHLAYELALNEEIQRKLQVEVSETWNQCNGEITYDAMVKMKYMDMVVSETLRKWSPAIFVDRTCTDTFTIEPENPGEIPLTLNKDDVVWFPIYALHRDPKYFPNPDKFDPERFNEENKDNIVPYSYLPFGIGPRNCIGSRFALLEAKVMFFHFLTKFNFVICEKSQVPLRLKKLDFNLSSERGYWLGLELRKDI